MHLYTIVENQPIEKKGTFQNTIKESYIGIGGGGKHFLAGKRKINKFKIFFYKPSLGGLHYPIINS